MSKSKVQLFREMHKPGRFVLLPNAWDTITALMFENAGFSAVATTSAGIAGSFGFKDGEILTLSQMLAVTEHMLNAVKVPLSVDIEAGYAESAEDIADNLVRVARLGAAGVNLEDMCRGEAPHLRSPDEFCGILRCARERLSASGCDLFINARTDTYLSKAFAADRVVEESIVRGRAYLEAGADCVFVPGVTDPVAIGKICQGIPGPVNMLALPGVTSAQALRELGVRRLSLGKAAYNHALAHAHAAALRFLSEADAGNYLNDLPPVPQLAVAGHQKAQLR